MVAGRVALSATRCLPGSAPHFLRQLAAMEFLVDLVQLAVLQISRDPLIELLDQSLFPFAYADRKVEVLDQDLRLKRPGRILDANLVNDRVGGCNAIRLA